MTSYHAIGSRDLTCRRCGWSQAPRHFKRLCRPAAHHHVTLRNLLQLRDQSFAIASIPPATEKEEQIKQTRYPIGWNQERVRKLRLHYEKQTEDEAVAQDEATSRRRGQTVIVVPKQLVPTITNEELLED